MTMHKNENPSRRVEFMMTQRYTKLTTVSYCKQLD